MDKRTLEVTEQAAETIADMHRRVSDLANHYGPDNEWTVEANRSLSWNLSQLFSRFFGNHATITKDGELSLFVAEYVSDARDERGYLASDPNFVYGLIWHGVRRQCKRCKLIQGYESYHRLESDEDNERWAQCERDGHDWNYPEGSPEPGSWSFHS